MDAGLETPETIQKWNEKYEHYVPLHRDEVDSSKYICGASATQSISKLLPIPTPICRCTSVQ
jgi:hypothetical protein